MIESLRAVTHGDQLRADVCVVGAGAAGLTIAGELADAGIEVLVVESGPVRDDGALHPLDIVEMAGVPNVGAEHGRARGFGGTLQRWGGQCMPFPREDLAPRAWVPTSGWPIDRAELAAYVDRAMGLLQIPAGTFDRHPWERWRRPSPRVDADRLVRTFSVFVPEARLIRRARRRLERSRTARVVLDATATGLRGSGPRRVDRLELHGCDGRGAEVIARHYVLCCGAIENARLLLLSGRETGGGLADLDPHGLVGRFFQDHLVAVGATVDPHAAQAFVEWFGLFRRGRLQFYPRLALSPLAQQRHRVRACTMNVEIAFGPGSGVETMRASLGRLRSGRPPSLGELGRLVRHSGEVGSFLYRHAVRGLPPHGEPASVSIVTMAEQAPDFDSRVSLSTARDVLGLPRARVEWHLSDEDRRTVRVAVETVRDEFERLGLPEVKIAPWLIRADAAWETHVSGSFHQVGTTRMASSADRGVVDPDCRVHGLDNLWVAGGSVFPTGGAVNPTLMIVALALRLADHLQVVATRGSATNPSDRRAGS